MSVDGPHEVLNDVVNKRKEEFVQTSIPCAIMRGGTSRGPVFRLSDLPEDRDTLAKVLLAVMGSPDERQIDGIGGAQ